MTFAMRLATVGAAVRAEDADLLKMGAFESGEKTDDPLWDRPVVEWRVNLHENGIHEN